MIFISRKDAELQRRRLLMFELKAGSRKARKERPQKKAPKISEPNGPRAMRLTQFAAQTNTNLRGTRDMLDFPKILDIRDTREMRELRIKIY
jgi:hypothetical protein